MDKKTNIFLAVIIIILMLFVGSFLLFALDKSFLDKESDLVNVAADDDEEDEEDKEDEEDEEDEEDDDDDDDDEKKTEVITIYETLPDRTSVKTETSTRYDSDGDGVFDNEDANPNINENFIVEDGDKNGIVDSYEQE
jgi:uncharacterized protein YxeA